MFVLPLAVSSPPRRVFIIIRNWVLLNKWTHEYHELQSSISVTITKFQVFYSLSGSLLSFLCFLSSGHCHYFLPEECVLNFLIDGSFISWVVITMPFLCLEHTSGPLVPEFLALNLNSLWPSVCLICSIIFCYSLQNFIFCLVKLTIFLSSTSSQSAIPLHLGSGDSQNSDCSALEFGKFQENQDHSNML